MSDQIEELSEDREFELLLADKQHREVLYSLTKIANNLQIISEQLSGIKNSSVKDAIENVAQKISSMPPPSVNLNNDALAESINKMTRDLTVELGKVQNMLKPVNRKLIVNRNKKGLIESVTEQRES